MPEFKALSSDLTALYSSNPTLTSTEYIVGTWTPLSRARAEFSVGGPEAFDEWVVGSMMIHPREAYAEFNTSVKVSVP